MPHGSPCTHTQGTAHETLDGDALHSGRMRASARVSWRRRSSHPAAEGNRRCCSGFLLLGAAWAGRERHRERMGRGGHVARRGGALTTAGGGGPEPVRRAEREGKQRMGARVSGATSRGFCSPEIKGGPSDVIQRPRFLRARLSQGGFRRWAECTLPAQVAARQAPALTHAVGLSRKPIAGPRASSQKKARLGAARY